MSYPHLTSSLQVGPLRLRNRCVIPGHGMRLGDAQGLIGERWRSYLVERARGGAAWIDIESAPVSEESRTELSSLPLYSDEVLPSLTAAAREVHAHGAVVSIILWHGGHHVPASTGHAAFSASAIPSFVTGEVPRAMSREDIRRVVLRYAQAASRCAAAGLDAVEIQTSSDYLLGSFLSTRLNRRADEYGGSLENRVRIVREILAAVRAAVGSQLAVGIRTSVSHRIPGDPHDYSMEDSLAIARLLSEREGLDYVSLLDGSHWSMEQMIAPMDTEHAPLANAGAAFRRATGLPVIVTGRIRDPDQAEAMLESGQADLIGMVRTWIAEPHWLQKLQRGAVASIRPCMSCNQGCLANVARGLPGTCVINVAAGRERQLGEPTHVNKPLGVAVVGAGPAGLECARVAAERGHIVTVYEREQHLGGEMRLAGLAPGRGEILDTIDWWERELRRLGVQIVTGARVGSDSIDAARVIWAVGGEPAFTSIWRRRPWLSEGIPGTQALPHGRDVLRGTTTVAGRVLIIDEEGGWPALSLVRTLLNTPAVTRVTVATAEILFGETDTRHTLELVAARSGLLRAGVELYEGVLAARVEDGTTTLADGRCLPRADAIVLSVGALPVPLPLRVAAKAQLIGDCKSPRGFWSAVNDGHAAGRAL